jgi:hypothetical protein
MEQAAAQPTRQPTCSPQQGQAAAPAPVWRGPWFARPGAAHPGRAPLRAFLAHLPGWAVAAVVYLGAAVAMWWHVWSGHPTSTMTCNCGDPSSFVWFLAWPAYAISHGQSLFFSTRVHVPGGINLLDNTSELALGVLLAPVTWLFGPIASLNVALTAAPSATALATYGAVRRGLRLAWPAAFLAGLLFGFSPFVMRNEAANHLQTSFLALLPLILWCCYELAVTQRGKWWRWGLGLGVLIALQFFVGSDVLTITAITAVLALAMAALAALSRKGTVSAKLPFAGRGFLLAAGVAGALLAYPLWFALAGPQHIKGPNWWHAAGNGLAQVLLPLGPAVHHNVRPVSGYLGHVGTFESYLGIPALVVLAVAAVVVHRPLSKLCAMVTLIAVWVSLGSSTTPPGNGGEPPWLPLPWRALDHLPLLEKLTPATFSAPAAFFTVVAGALLVDELLRPHDSAGLAGTSPAEAAGPNRPGKAIAQLPSARVLAAVVVSAALVIPWLAAWRLPYTTEHIAPSSWATHDGTHLPADAVVLFFPFPTTYLDQALIWQAVSGMRYSVVGGRGIVAGRDGAADHGWTPGTPEGTMTALTVRTVPHYQHLRLPPRPGPAAVRAFRDALRRWGVTNVVMTAGGRNPAYARQWLTAMLGTPPQPEHGAWVWNDVGGLISSHRI